MAGIQVNRTLSGVVLPVEVSNEIWQGVQQASVIQQVARRVPITGAGVTVPMITGDAVADWVGETDEKPVSRPTLSNKTFTPYKLALIVPFSNEFKRDLPTLYSALVARLPNAIARKYDETVLGYDTSPGSGFDTLAAIAEQELTGPTCVTDVATAVETIVTAVPEANVSATLATLQSDMLISKEVDSENRPLFADPNGVYSRFGGTVVRNQHVYDPAISTVGFVGDFANYAVWGAVGGIEVAVSDQATIQDGVTSLNLWQRNMFAIRVEATLAFGLRDADAFVRYTSTAAASS